MHRQLTRRQSHRRIRPVRCLVALVASSAVLLAGCSSGSSTTSSSPGRAAGGAPAQDNLAHDSSSGPNPVPEASTIPGAKAVPGGSAELSRSGSPTVSVGPKLTKSASLDVQVKDVVSAAARVRSIAAGLQAQVVSEQIGRGGTGEPVPLQNPKELPPATGGSRISGDIPGDISGDSGGFGTLTLSVPADKLDSALDQLAKVGTVLNRSTSSQDVTTQYVDTQSRLKTMRASVERVRALMAQAKDLGQVVALESEMSRRQADLESLESQLAALASQVERSTVAVSLSTPGAETVSSNGFLAGLRSGWDAFTSSTSGLFRAIGAVLPFALFFAAAAAPLVWWLRRRRTPATSAASS